MDLEHEETLLYLIKIKTSFQYFFLLPNFLQLKFTEEDFFHQCDC